MAQSIRHRRGSPLPQRPGRSQGTPQADSPEARALDRFEAMVPWYHSRVLEALDSEQAAALNDAELAEAIGTILRRLELASGAPAIGSGHASLATRLVDEMRGLGPIGPLLRDPDVSDILVNGLQSVYIERKGRLSRVDIRFRNADHLTRIAQRIAANVGRRIDELSPMCDARLEDGSRVNIIGPPLAIDGAAISIRRFRKGGFTVQELARGGAMHAGMAKLLEVATRAQLNVVVAGGTGAGKTTILNALSGNIDAEERVVTLEDAAELNLRQPHVVRLETRAPSSEHAGEITMRDLLKNALRMRPDRIIVGEVRGPEALEALQAMNTGHPGSMFTVHANNPRDTLSRLEYLVMMGSGEIPLSAIRNQVVSAVDLIVQAARFRDGKRRIVSITDVAGLEGRCTRTRRPLGLRCRQRPFRVQRRAALVHRARRGHGLRRPAERRHGPPARPDANLSAGPGMSGATWFSLAGVAVAFLVGWSAVTLFQGLRRRKRIRRRMLPVAGLLAEEAPEPAAAPVRAGHRTDSSENAVAAWLNARYPLAGGLRTMSIAGIAGMAAAAGLVPALSFFGMPATLAFLGALAVGTGLGWNVGAMLEDAKRNEFGARFLVVLEDFHRMVRYGIATNQALNSVTAAAEDR